MQCNWVILTGQTAWIIRAVRSQLFTVFQLSSTSRLPLGHPQLMYFSRPPGPWTTSSRARTLLYKYIQEWKWQSRKSQVYNDTTWCLVKRESAKINSMTTIHLPAKNERFHSCRFFFSRRFICCLNVSSRQAGLESASHLSKSSSMGWGIGEEWNYPDQCWAKQVFACAQERLVFSGPCLA